MKGREWGAVLALGLGLLGGCASFHGSNDQDDLWWAEDKAKHVTLSAALATGTTWEARHLGAPTPGAAAGGVSLTLSAGLAKELWDATVADGTGWSWKDLTWDLAGTLLGTWAGTALPPGR